METSNQRALLLRASIGAASIKAAATREYTYVAYPKRNRSCLHASDTEITTAHVPRMQMQVQKVCWIELKRSRNKKGLLMESFSLVQSTSPTNHGEGNRIAGLHRRSGLIAPRGAAALVLLVQPPAR